jgi:hypothetical protein
LIVLAAAVLAWKGAAPCTAAVASRRIETVDKHRFALVAVDAAITGVPRVLQVVALVPASLPGSSRAVA